MIRIQDLAITAGGFSVENVSINIAEGEFHFLLGPTGSGKTLILEAITGLRKIRHGKIAVGGKEVQGLPPERRQISYVPQDIALFPHLTVEENILFGLKAKGSPEGFSDHVRSLIEVARIAPLLKRYPAGLSGGEKKRVALLRALAPQPKLLLLDEPLSGLDPPMKTEIQHLLKTIRSSFNPTALYVTHDFEEAYFLGDAITVCIEGKIVQTGQRDEVFLRPRSKAVAEFLGGVNVFSATVVERDGVNKRWILDVNGLSLSVPESASNNSLNTGKKVDLYVRAEEVMILREGKPIKPALTNNIFNGKIEFIMNKGRNSIVWFCTEDGRLRLEISIPSYVLRNLDLMPGRKTSVAIRDEGLWVMA